MTWKPQSCTVIKGIQWFELTAQFCFVFDKKVQIISYIWAHATLASVLFLPHHYVTSESCGKWAYSPTQQGAMRKYSQLHSTVTGISYLLFLK